jgi:hypothetical protein
MAAWVPKLPWDTVIFYQLKKVKNMNQERMKNEYWLYLLLVTIAVGGGCLLGFYLARQYYSDVESRVQALETQFVASLKPGQEIKVDELKVYVDKEVGTVKEQFDWVIKLGLPATIIALLASIFKAYNWAAQIAKERAEAAFKDPETILKENAKIMVLTPPGQDESWLQRFFFLMGFSQVTFKRTTDLEALKNEKCDLVVLNVPDDQSRATSNENDLLNNITIGKSILYFGPGQVSNEQLDKASKLSFANAKSQLYGNLINALKFQKAL